MTSKYCPGCGTERTDPNAPCSKCGYQKDPEFSKKLIKFAILFAILGLIWMLFLTKNMWAA